MRMQANGYYAKINLPVAPKGEGKVHGLPPYDVKNVYAVDEYEGCPANWMHGSDKASSYFLPVEPGRHLWLDFNDNAHGSHHVAIVVSVQGINPVTGQKTDHLRLEQYREKCPLHSVTFGQDRYCPSCDFKWPSQNYLTTVSTPQGKLWIDGWRAAEGEIRGFLITKEMTEGIAAQLIGQERVFAIGMAFYPMKTPKPQPLPSRSPLRSASLQSMSNHIYKSGGISGQSLYAGGDSKLKSHAFTSQDCADDESPIVFSESLGGSRGRSIEPQEKLEIAAGAKIQQELSYYDPTDLSEYSTEPAAMIYINYCTEKDFDRIMRQGQKDLTKQGEGFMSGLKTGNP